MRFSVFLSLSLFFFFVPYKAAFFFFVSRVAPQHLSRGRCGVSRKNEKRCANLSSELSLVAVVVLELSCVLRGKKKLLYSTA